MHIHSDRPLHEWVLTLGSLPTLVGSTGYSWESSSIQNEKEIFYFCSF